MRSTDKIGITHFISECLNYGMKDFVCSPGSRNAPLVIAIDEHPELNTIVIHDERSAAFYAIGLAQESHCPVGVVCTSGSAMLNYYPAVAEAFYRCIPLVVISADRPFEWINQGDGQTIVQDGVYENHIRYSGIIEENAASDVELTKLRHIVAQAFEFGNGNWKGPIHFNVPLSEPLYNTVEIEPLEYKEINPVLSKGLQLTSEQKDQLQTKWSASKRKMIICGQMDKDKALLESLTLLNEDTSLVILTENTSNLKGANFIHCIDRTLSAIGKDELELFQPDLLISLGGAVISKRIKDFLRSSNLKENWKVGYEFPEMDTYKSRTESFQCRPAVFIETLLQLNLENNVSTFGNKWKQRDFEIQGNLNSIMNGVPFSDLKVFEMLLDYVPSGANLHMGNSSVVRYCQLFEPDSLIEYFSNRGTSGIDGCTSTACGAALANRDKINVVITGDISFFYDSNALWSNHLTENLRIILINNKGGGIFKIIEGPSSVAQLDKFFEASHNGRAKDLCGAFNVDYSQADSLEQLESIMHGFYLNTPNKRPKLLEINTPSEVNDLALKDFFKALQTF